MWIFYIFVAIIASGTAGMAVAAGAPLSALLSAFVAFCYGSAALKGNRG